MRMIRLIASIPLLLVMSACVPLPCLNPLWDDEHLVSEPALIGTWASDNKEVIAIAESGVNEYRMTYINDDSASQYQVHAVRLGGHLFLDLYPGEDTLKRCSDKEALLPLIPTHFFLRVVLAGDRLELAALDDDTIAKSLEQEEIDVPLVKWRDGVLLTAPTQGIQDLVIRLADDPEVWGEPDLYYRCD